MPDVWEERLPITLAQKDQLNAALETLQDFFGGSIGAIIVVRDEVIALAPNPFLLPREAADLALLASGHVCQNRRRGL
jgi:hypothetical protein